MVLFVFVVMGVVKFNYGMEIRDEDYVCFMFVYGVFRVDLEEVGKKFLDFFDCDKMFDVFVFDK